MAEMAECSGNTPWVTRLASTCQDPRRGIERLTPKVDDGCGDVPGRLMKLDYKVDDTAILKNVKAYGAASSPRVIRSRLWHNSLGPGSRQRLPWR
jgi:hypothetical protein